MHSLPTLAAVSYLWLQCLAYFAKLAKHGSVNARPVELFMLALKNPMKAAFVRAINACGEAKFIHLKAMALERYSEYLRTQNDTQLANDCISSAYCSYRDWGANAKALELQQSYDFLKVSVISFTSELLCSTTVSNTFVCVCHQCRMLSKRVKKALLPAQMKMLHQSLGISLCTSSIQLSRVERKFWCLLKNSWFAAPGVRYRLLFTNK